MRRPRSLTQEAWPYRVYTYGATLRAQSTPPTWPEPLREVILAQRDLWNACVRAWETNRAQYDALLAHAAHLQPLQAAVEAAKAAVQTQHQAIKDARRTSRRAAYPTAIADAAALAAARLALRQATGTYSEAAALWRRTMRPQLTAMLEALWTEVHALGQASPLAWYNERLVTDSFRSAVERFLRRQGGPPKPRRGLTTAHLTYHFTGGPLTWEQLLDGKTAMIQVDAPEPWVWDETLPQNLRRRAARTTARLRISDTSGVEFGVTLQRRPPEGARIKGVELIGREVLRPFVGRPGRWRWQWQVLCEVPPVPLAGADDPRPRAALDLNWRILADDRVRIGMLYDGTTHMPVYFPTEFVRRWRYAQSLQNELAAALERCKADLLTVWEVFPLPPDVDPRGAGWVQTGQGGLVRLLRAVEAVPVEVPSRAPTLDVLGHWSQRTYRLWREWRGLTARLERAKAALYAVLAKTWATQYRALAVEALDLRAMAEREGQGPRLQESQKYRHLVGLGGLLLRLTHTAAREGLVLVPVDPAWSTRECPRCGAHLAEQQGDLILVCPQGHAYDQDEGASEVLWRRAFGEEPIAAQVRQG